MPGQIFAALGERQAQALLSGDFAVYASVMALPLRIIPRDDDAYVLHTEAELHADFQLYHDSLKGRGVTDIFRQVVAFTVIDPSHLKVRCKTHIMVQAQRIVDPFDTEFLLVAQSDGWLIAEVRNARGHSRFGLGLSEINRRASAPQLDDAGGDDGET